MNIAQKKIKRYIYGAPQIIRAIFPAGFGEIAFEEVKHILNSPWYPQKFISECVLLKNEIRISNIHMIQVMELMMRSQCLSDIQLVISEGKTFKKHAFEKHVQEINWDFYLNQDMSVKITVDSIASHVFHESSLKTILTDVIKNCVSAIISGDGTNETTRLYANLYKNKLTVSISLAGKELYKRGYREELSASAPLREDIAACCIKRSLAFASQMSETFIPEEILIPFSGTGTLAFEFMQLYYHIPPVMFERKYAIEKMPLFRQDTFSYLLKKAQASCVFAKNIKIQCIDKSEPANASCLINLKNFEKKLMQHQFNMIVKQDNFLEMNIENISVLGNIFIPLNPPYGVRLGTRSTSIVLYKEIAKKINALSSAIKNAHKQISGFILCPDEATWNAFCKHLIGIKFETYHFTQGGLDVRACQFFMGSSIRLTVA